ncbi:hypothetical protein PC110_g12518 [Phytophthora cactorum]|uniref:Integrase catalytic domain-containing protein n=1 Tax=Phytophthora cactorum TaxID=29920 RepID=A0A329S2R7_9STRA|nr:hypothetical protein PC110_g12518 [Phytophthora cactorum]
MLVREKGFHVYCDHSNLIQLFTPDREVKQHVKVKRVTTRSAQTVSDLRPLQDDQFSWPTRSEIVRVQQEYREDVPDEAVDTNDGIEIGGKLWLPAKATALLKRLFVVAHCGPQGHRGVNVMIELLDRRFVLSNLRQAATRFVNQYLLCKRVKGGLVILRDWTVDRPVPKRNDCLHLDYLYLGESYGDAKYMLVLKDELTHFCELVPTDSADSQTAVVAILDWNKRFGIPEMWVSDNGSHVKNQVMEWLAERLDASHQFVPVYTPWINGTAKLVNHDILQVLRVMLLERRLDTRNWVHLLPIIQANLNHTPVYSLGNCDPVELFTGLPSASTLDISVTPSARVLRDLPMEKTELREAVDALRRSLHDLHRAVRDRRERQRAVAMARSKGIVCNFSEGDYVTKALPHSFLIRHLLTGAEYDVHGSLLKFYHGGDLDVTAEIREHVSLQDIENSWEPAHSIKRDVPALVSKYAMDNGVEELL